ncbi:MAG: DUF2950 family protein [Planctomycetota bacterium]|nr:DUF2950 family protein [Planctomycetota bacterium]
MPASWFYAKGDSSDRKGPINIEDLKKLGASGYLAPGDLVWREGMESWTPFEQVPELAGSSVPPPPIPSTKPTTSSPTSASSPQPGPIPATRGQAPKPGPMQKGGLPKTVLFVVLGVGVLIVLIALVFATGKKRIDPQVAQEMRQRSRAQAIAMCWTYGEAQNLYRRADWDEDGVLEYAQAATGQYSLFEKAPGAGDLQLLSFQHSKAFVGPNGEPPAEPLEGYQFAILTGQGTGAPGGARSFVVGGNMTQGYGIVAWPAEYSEITNLTFIMTHQGIVYEADLGPDTSSQARELVQQGFSLTHGGANWSPIPEAAPASQRGTGEVSPLWGRGR